MLREIRPKMGSLASQSEQKIHIIPLSGLGHEMAAVPDASIERLVQVYQEPYEVVVCVRVLSFFCTL